MLSYNEVNEYFSLVQPKLINQNELLIDMSVNFGNTNMITKNGRIVGVLKFTESAKALANEELYHTTTFWLKDSPQTVVFDKKVCWLYKANNRDCVWEKSLDFESIEELEGYIVDNQKCVVLDALYMYINSYRAYERLFLISQPTVYMAKYLEAKEIIDNNVVEDSTLKYPFTTGYADVVGISLQEAAKKIMFKYETRNAFLAESENFRIRITNDVKKCKTLDEVLEVYNNFLSQKDRYGYL